MTKSFRILVLLLLVAFALRIFNLPQTSLRADEAVTVFDVSTDWGTLIQKLSTPGPHQPLYYVLLHGWMKLAGDSELASRYLSLSSGILLLPLVFVLGRRLFPRDLGAVGLWASLLVAINPMLILDARDNRMYPLLAVFNLLSVYFSLSILRNRGGWKHWIGYVASTTLALYTHYLAAFIVITENIIWVTLIWPLPHRTRRVARWFTAQAVAGLLFAPWLFRYMTVVSEFSTDFLPLVGPADMLRRALVGLSLGRSVEPEIGILVSFGFLLTLVLGLWPRTSRSRDTAASTAGSPAEGWSLLVLLMYLVVPITCIAAFSILRFPIFDERYILLAMPPYLLILGRGLRNLSAQRPRRWLAAFGLVCVLLATGFSLRNFYFDPSSMKGLQADWRTYVARLLESAEPGDVLIQNLPDPGLTYYLRDQIPRVLLPANFPVDVEHTESELRHISETYDRIWLQPQIHQKWDSEGLVEAWLDRHTLKVAEERISGLRLSLYLPPQSLEEIRVPIQTVLGGQIQLTGYLLSVGSELQERELGDPSPSLETPPIHPGEILQLALFWQPLTEIQTDYTVFVHLYDSNDTLWAQRDNPPVSGTYRTNQWKPGQTIVDSYEIQLPPDLPTGEYRLAVGMYDWVTGDRLAVTGNPDRIMSDSRILLAPVQIGGNH